MKNLEYKQARTKITSSGEVKILGASFLNIDRGREIILPGAYAKHVETFSQRGRLLVDHKNSVNALAGHVTDSYESQKGLVITGSFSSDQVGQWARQKAMEGTLKSTSIGHYVHAEKIAGEAEVKSIWAQHNYTPTSSDLRELKKGPVRLLIECEPVECSFVAVPMNDESRILEVKTMANKEEKRGATFNRGNLAAIKQVYALVKGMLASAKSNETPENQDDIPAATESHSVTTTTVKNDRASLARLRLELLDLELKTSGGQ